MEYTGALYGKIGRKYFPTGKTANDWDKLEAKVVELQELVNKNNLLSDVMPRFEIDYTFTDRMDASTHKETIQAETGEEALNELHRKHNYKIEWLTIKKLNEA